MRAFFLTILKLALVAGLLWWLVGSGKLDFHQLRVLVLDPQIFAANVALWSLGYVGLGSFRWYLLLRGQDLEMPFWRTLRLHLIGFFFNTAMPGAVGGDVVKAVYVVREQKKQAKTPALLTVLLDRVIGLSGLFALAGVAAATNFSFFRDQPALWPLVAFVAAGLVGTAVLFAVVMLPFAPGKDPIVRLLDRKLPVLPALLRIYEAMRSYRRRPLIIFGTLAISCVIQSATILYGYFLTVRLTGQIPQPGVFATLYAAGTTATALPLAPGGLGVGHVAFEKLFALAGLTGGANVFNVVALGTLAMNLLGVIPYLFYRAQLPDLKSPQSEGDDEGGGRGGAETVEAASMSNS